jgi:acylphosphatase
MPALLLTITGRVQGVGYRAFTAGEATRLGISGWVRNRADRSVAALVAGPQQALDSLLVRLNVGPPGSRVDKLEWRIAEVPDNSGFVTLPTL